ncbi:MAG: STAS/SEC14 domain-containing protein, partial [Gammaproteobacteria bacterium]
EPQAALEAADFERLVQAVDPFIEQAGGLNGLMIYSDSFPGWDDFQALVSHIRFISNHHQAIRRVAFVTDSAVLTLLPRMASHFVTVSI